MSNWTEKKRQDVDNDYGVLSMDENSKIYQKKVNINATPSVKLQCDNWVAPKLKSLLLQQQSPSHFRIMVCGDSGKFKVNF